jgi:antirestriction protein ArdC
MRPLRASGIAYQGINVLMLERIPVTLKRSLHVGSNWRILAD